jgi:hypothetical protein
MRLTKVPVDGAGLRRDGGGTHDTSVGGGLEFRGGCLCPRSSGTRYGRNGGSLWGCPLLFCGGIERDVRSDAVLLI